MPTDRVLIEVVTAANMAGIQQAQAGFLGLTPQIALAGVALAGLVFVGKSAVDNYEKQEKASKDLAQAVASVNDQFQSETDATDKQREALTKSQDALNKTQDSLTISTNAVTKAQLAYTDAVKKHGKTSEEAYKAALNLQDASIRLKEAQDANADAENAVTAATAAMAPRFNTVRINLGALVTEFQHWSETNKRYVPDQYAAEAALASFVRSGQDGVTSMRLLNDALDLSTIKTEGIDEATKTLILALNGNSKGLRDLGISTKEYKAIMDGTGTTQEKGIQLLTLIETRTKEGRKATTELEQSQNELNKDWQDFTARIGPAVIGTLAGILEITDAIISGTAPGVGKFVPGGRFAGAGGGGRSPGQQSLPPGFGYTGTGGAGSYGNVSPGPGPGYAAPTVNIDLRGAIVPDGPSLDRLSNLIARRLSYVSGQ